MTTYRKKLIEVALPLDAINRGCEEDKNRKKGHIRNLHKWFAPMPLPAWRGSIEDADMNRRIVDVLEGTRPAFDQRDARYQP